MKRFSIFVLLLVLLSISLGFSTQVSKGLRLEIDPKEAPLETEALIILTNIGTEPITIHKIVVKRPRGTEDELKFEPGLNLDPAVNMIFVYPLDWPSGNVSEEGNYTVTASFDSMEVVEIFSRVAVADLTITALSAEQRATCSWEADVKARVKNIGDGAASGVVVAFYVDGTRLSTPSSFDLAPGQEKTVSTSWTMGTGSYTLYAKVDPDNAISESNEANNELTKSVGVEVERKCDWDPCAKIECGYNADKCGTECVRTERYCCYPQNGQCREWCERCVEERSKYCCWCVGGWVNCRDCPVLHDPDHSQFPALIDQGQAAKIPWSGWWWPLRDSVNPNLYDKGGPLDKYDQYILATRGYNPGAREWEEKAQGSALLFFTIEVERDNLKGRVVLGKHGSTIDNETLAALDLLKELITGVTPQDQIEERIKQLEETMFVGGLWWKSFKGDIPSLQDLLANAWTIKSESREEGGEAAGWMGICHGLAAASVMEDEPMQPRTLHGIDFTVADLKGLLTKVWQEAYFESWEPTPKNFHEKLQEIIGAQGKPLIMDLARGIVAANHPAYQYEIKKVKEEGATATFEVKVWFADYASPDFVGTNTFTRTYSYSLVFDDQGNIIGDGTWISTDYPDSLWIPTAPRPGNPRVDLAIVYEILRGPSSPEP